MKCPSPKELRVIECLKNLPKPGDSIIVIWGCGDSTPSIDVDTKIVTKVLLLDILDSQTIIYYIDVPTYAHGRGVVIDRCFYDCVGNIWTIGDDEVKVFWNIDWDYDQSPIVPC